MAFRSPCAGTGLFLAVCLALGCESTGVPVPIVQDAGSGTGGSGSGGTLGTGGTGGISGTGGTGGDSGGSGGNVPEPDAGITPEVAPDVLDPPDVRMGETRPGMPPIADGTEYTKNGPYPLHPDAMPKAGVPVGDIMTFNMPRTWRLYVPKQYDAAKPAALMIFQDGDLYGSRTGGTFKTPVVLDNLIASGELPVMLAAFIPASGQRSVEYDSLNDTYAQLVTTQIVTQIEARYKITKNPEGRGLGGQSSGGIAAFTVAWNMPDKYRRVLTDNGSFTNIRGGNMYPDLIRAAPVKPLRVTLLSSTMDIRGTAVGGWLDGNKNMAAALKEKGYPYIFMIGNGGHYPPVQGASVHPTHMKWLWWDYVPDGT